MTDYSDVWPSKRIEDTERTNLQQHGEVIIDTDVSFQEVLYAADDLGIDWEDLRLEPVGAVGGIALRVWVDSPEPRHGIKVGLPGGGTIINGKVVEER